MNDPYEVAKKIQAEFKKTGFLDVEQELKFTEFLSRYEGSDKIVKSTDLTDKIKGLENETRYYTGIKKLDDILDGFRGGQLIVVGAPPKSGKTNFCVELARRIPNSTMFLFEESAEEVLYKYHAKGLPLPIFYTPADVIEYNVDSLYRKMIEAWAKFDSKVFFIDHLHFVVDTNGTQRLDLSIKDVMQELSRFKKMHGFTIFLVTHLSKGNFKEPVGVDAIRDSSFIAQYADTVLMLWREVYESGASEHKNVINYTKNLLINVALNRKINFVKDSNTGLCDLTFNTDTWQYDDSEWYTEWIQGDREEQQKEKSVISKIQE